MARLSRAGVSVDAELLEKYDQFIAALGFTNRSEALRRMIREELARSDTTAAGRGVVGVVTLGCSRRALFMRIAPARLDPGSGCNVLAPSMFAWTTVNRSDDWKRWLLARF